MGQKALGDEADDTNALSRKSQLSIHIENHEGSIWCKLTLIWAPFGRITLCSSAKGSREGQMVKHS